MKVSFDFDSCLSTKRIQLVAKKHIAFGHDVWITTSRFSNEHGIKNNWPWIIKQNKQLVDIATELGIPYDKIQFCNMVPKWKFLDGFDIHFDDDDTEIEMIEENLPNCATILVLTPFKNE